MAARVLLDALAASVDSLAGGPHDVERVHHRCRAGELLGGGGLEAGGACPSPSILAPVRQAAGRAESQRLNTCFERPSTMSSSRAGPVP